MYHYFLSKNKYMLHMRRIQYGDRKAHQVTHNHVLLIIMESVRGVQQSSGSQTVPENTQLQLPILPFTKKGFNEQLHVPSGDPCCHESCSISVPFHPALLLQTWHSLFLSLLRGTARYSNFDFSPVQMLSLRWLKFLLHLSLYKFLPLWWAA